MLHSSPSASERSLVLKPSPPAGRQKGVGSPPKFPRLFACATHACLRRARGVKSRTCDRFLPTIAKGTRKQQRREECVEEKIPPLACLAISDEGHPLLPRYHRPGRYQKGKYFARPDGGKVSTHSLTEEHSALQRTRSSTSWNLSRFRGSKLELKLRAHFA